MYISNVENAGQKQLYLKNNIKNPEQKLNQSVLSSKNQTIIKANELNTNNDSIEDKKNYNCVKSMRKVISTFTNQQNTDDTLKSLYNNIDELRNESKNIIDEQQKNSDLINQLINDYGITTDSEEYLNYQVLSKQQSIKNGASFDNLTKQDKMRLNNIDEISEFTQRALEIDNRTDELNKNLSTLNNKISAAVGSISEIKIENLKQHKMIDATNEEKKTLLNGAKDIVNMIMQKGKEKIDELKENVHDKIKENTTKNEDEIKENEIKSEKNNEQNKNINNNSSGPSKTSSHTTTTLDINQMMDPTYDELTNEIQAMIKAQQLTADDVMGVTVDKSL